MIRDFRQSAEPVPDREIINHGFFPLDALPEGTTRGTRARIAEVLHGVRASGGLVGANARCHRRCRAARRYAGQQKRKKETTMTRLLAAVAALTLMLLGGREAQSIKVVVPFAAGGPVDMLARLFAADMQTRLKTDIVIENRGGGGGVIATELVARAPATARRCCSPAPARM